MELLTVWVRNPSACFPSRRHPDRCPDSAQIMRMRLSSAKSFCSMGDGQILHSLHQRKIAIAVWWLGRGSAIRRTAEFEPRAWRSCRVQSTISSRTFEESLVLRCPVNADPRSLCRWVFFSTVDELFMRASKRRYGRSNRRNFILSIHHLSGVQSVLAENYNGDFAATASPLCPPTFKDTYNSTQSPESNNVHDVASRAVAGFVPQVLN